MNKKISYCGYECENCPIFLATKNNDIESLKRINYLGPNIDCSIESYGCLGCKSELNNQMCKTCFMKKCATKRNISNCGECEEYPCDYTSSFLSVETRNTLNQIHEKKLNYVPRVAIIGMSGDSLFYDVSGEEKKLVHREAGGKGYNQAIACIRNGVKVSYLTAVGSDEVGKMLEEYMINEGIDTFFIKKNKPSLAANILVDADGNNTVLYDRSNVSELEVEDVYAFEDEIKRSDCLLLQYEYKKDIIITAINLAKKHKKMVVVNPAPMIYSDVEMLKDVDVITPNEEEAYKLFGAYRKESFDYIINKQQKSPFKMVLNTLGSSGVILVNSNSIIKYNPIKVKAVDTTGAGDTFNGIFVSEFLKTNDIDKSVKKAVIGSGISVTKKYVMGAIPYEDDINEYIKKLNK